ncbi:MAG: hypothetical protein AAFY59_18520, partial [Pseudomonadota bacterium]
MTVLIRCLSALLWSGIAAFAVWHFYSDELTPADRKILFVGNSFLFMGDVPGQVRRLAASGPEPIVYHTRMIAKPSYRLAQHVEEGEALRELRSGVWDVVVLQEFSGGTFTAAGRAEMLGAVERLGAAAREAGTEVVLYAHWPPGPALEEGRAGRVDWIAQAYGEVAAATGASLAPVGRL